MASHKQKVRDCELFPHAKKKWIETIDKLMQTKWMDDRGGNSGGKIRVVD